jgi:hypothetical protein
MGELNINLPIRENESITVKPLGAFGVRVEESDV